jgi:hypothetical protein
VGLERYPLSLVRTEELFECKLVAPGLENRDSRPWGSVALTTRHPLHTSGEAASQKAASEETWNKVPCNFYFGITVYEMSSVSCSYFAGLLNHIRINSNLYLRSHNRMIIE